MTHLFHQSLADCVGEGPKFKNIRVGPKPIYMIVIVGLQQLSFLTENHIERILPPPK